MELKTEETKTSGCVIWEATSDEWKHIANTLSVLKYVCWVVLAFQAAYLMQIVYQFANEGYGSIAAITLLFLTVVLVVFKVRRFK
jgi:hypothetical protein